jgi:hypothetical protein
MTKVTKSEKKTISDLISTDFFDVDDFDKLTEEDTRRDGGNLKYFKDNPKHARQLLRKKKSTKSKSKRKLKK